MRPIALFPLLTLLALAACQPVFRTSYDFEPPAAAEARACVDQCAAAQSQCKRGCDLQAPNCGDPITYPGSRPLSGAPPTHPFYNTSFGGIGAPDLDCTDLEPVLQSGLQCREACEDVYRRCYAGCGGRVIPHRRCVAFCP